MGVGKQEWKRVVCLFKETLADWWGDMGARPSLLFFGAGPFSRVCFKHLLDARSDWSKIGIVTTYSGSELSKYAQEQGIKTVITPKEGIKGWLPDDEPWDFGVVASFPHFIPRALIDWFRAGEMLNAHPSLLPRYRGAAPIQRAMIDGAPLGISVIDVHRKRFDAGRIYYQESVDVESGMAYREVEELLAVRSGLALGRVLSDWPAFKTSAKEQCDDGISIAPKITVDDAQVSFKKDPAASIYRRFLAIGHQETLRARFGQRLVHLVDIVPPIAPKMALSPGQLFYERAKQSSTLWVAAADDQWLGCRNFRVEGKSTTFAPGAFYNGFCKNTATFD